MTTPTLFADTHGIASAGQGSLGHRPRRWKGQSVRGHHKRLEAGTARRGRFARLERMEWTNPTSRDVLQSFYGARMLGTPIFNHSFSAFGAEEFFGFHPRRSRLIVNRDLLRSWSTSSRVLSSQLTRPRLCFGRAVLDGASCRLRGGDYFRKTMGGLASRSGHSGVV